MNKSITIINTKTANIASVVNAVKAIGHVSVVSEKSEDIKSATHLILPGVGSFDTCLKQIRLSGIRDLIIDSASIEKKPLLGICVGMQALFDGSHEGDEQGLSLASGCCELLRSDETLNYKVPNNGFSEVIFSRNNILSFGLREREYFYFNHSYGIVNPTSNDGFDLVKHSDWVLASFQMNNVFGLQYHPEKSQLAGLKVLSNFINYNLVSSI